MANDETYLDEQREEVRARLQRFQDEQKAINDQIRINFERLILLPNLTDKRINHEILGQRNGHTW